MAHYDLVIIGAGSGNMIVNRGYSGLEVATVEDRRFGGTCLNVGCIPTKMFVVPADLIRSVNDSCRLGVRAHVDCVDWPAIRDRIFGRIDPDAAEARRWRAEAPNHTVYDACAQFTGDHTIRIRNHDGSTETVTADQFVIAAGRRPTIPDLPGLDGVDFHTSDTVMRLEELPASMLVIGGGPVAAEFAHIFSAYGTAITQIVRGDLLLRHADADIARTFTALASQKWEVRLGRQVSAVRRTGEGVTATLDDGFEVWAETLLVATGRESNADRLNLPAAGVEVDRDNVIVVDRFQRTTAPGIWAMGDIANHHQLKHVANHEARVIKHNLLNPDDLVAANHDAIPRAVFSSPQIAWVGLTEAEASRAGTPYVTAIERYGDVAYGWALEDTDHFVKLLADPGSGRLLGAHILGPDASVLIQPLIQAISTGLTVPEMSRGQYWIHPSLSEVVENALLKIRT